MFSVGGFLRRESQNLFCCTVIHALKFTAAANWPVHGIRFNAQFLFNLVRQVIGTAGIAVHFIDKRKNWNMAQCANLKQLTCLFFYALGGINHHDGAVRGHQGTVGILGKIRMPGGIQDIDTIIVVFKLHDRRSDRNATLFFNIHPVRNCVAHVALAFNHTGLLNGTAVQQELFRQRCFAGVWVRDDCERAPALNFLFIVCHL